MQHCNDIDVEYQTVANKYSMSYLLCPAQSVPSTLNNRKRGNKLLCVSFYRILPKKTDIDKFRSTRKVPALN